MGGNCIFADEAEFPNIECLTKDCQVVDASVEVAVLVRVTGFSVFWVATDIEESVGSNSCIEPLFGEVVVVSVSRRVS